MTIRKAVFPVAGFGTRFLPATKAMPKELLPVIDKPVIQYAVEEAVSAGFETLVFITGRNKRAIEDHFDSNIELEQALKSKGRFAEAKMVREIVPSNVECVFIRQPEQLGLGHAVSCAEEMISVLVEEGLGATRGQPLNVEKLGTEFVPVHCQPLAAKQRVELQLQGVFKAEVDLNRPPE